MLPWPAGDVFSHTRALQILQEIEPINTFADKMGFLPSKIEGLRAIKQNPVPNLEVNPPPPTHTHAHRHTPLATAMLSLLPIWSRDLIKNVTSANRWQRQELLDGVVGDSSETI